MSKTDGTTEKMLGGLVLLRLAIEHKSRSPHEYTEAERRLTELLTELTGAEARQFLCTVTPFFTYLMALILSRACPLQSIGVKAERLLDSLSTCTGKDLVELCERIGIDMKGVYPPR
jgi:hypothetical protein